MTCLSFIYLPLVHLLQVAGHHSGLPLPQVGVFTSVSVAAYHIDLPIPHVNAHHNGLPPIQVHGVVYHSGLSVIQVAANFWWLPVL